MIQPFGKIVFKRERKKQEQQEKRQKLQNGYSDGKKTHHFFKNSKNPIANQSKDIQESIQDFPDLSTVPPKELNQAINEGKKEAIKESVKSVEENEKKFEKLISNSETVLLKIKAFWPFDLFPNEVTIDLNKVSVYYYEFFYSGENRSVLIKNIADASVQTGLFFATLKISTVFDRNTGATNPGSKSNIITVEYLKRNEAIQAKRIINGLLIAMKENIDLTKMTKDEIKEKIEKLGQAIEGDE